MHWLSGKSDIFHVGRWEFTFQKARALQLFPWGSPMTKNSLQSFVWGDTVREGFWGWNLKLFSHEQSFFERWYFTFKVHTNFCMKLYNVALLVLMQKKNLLNYQWNFLIFSSKSFWKVDYFFLCWTYFLMVKVFHVYSHS